jgi:hypothetical protein
VGAAREGDTLWGKAYVVPGPVRERIARYKAQGKAIATSIDAFAEGIYDTALDAYRMAANSLRLNQIDIAPADRAGIPDLAAVPLLTTEMESEPDPEPEQELEVDKLQIINEMTPEDARLLPVAVREAIQAEVPTPAEVAVVTELRQALGVDDKADLAQIVTELRQAEQTRKAEAVKVRITELASDPEKGIKVEDVRGLVVEMVALRNPQTVQEAETAYQQVVEMDVVKAALKGRVQATMGPRQGTPVAPQQGQAKYFKIPTEVN